MEQIYDYIVGKQKKKKRKISTTGFTFNPLPLSNTNNKQMVQHLLDNAKLEEVSDVLTCKPREAVTALKWLQLHSKRGVSLDLWHTKYQQLREAKQTEGDEIIEQVKETVYYPLLLAFFEAAALGQSEVLFLSQNFSKPTPHEDIVGMVNGVAECPCEVKLVTCVSLGGKDGGVQANIEAFAGLAQCLSKIAGKTNIL